MQNRAKPRRSGALLIIVRGTCNLASKSARGAPPMSTKSTLKESLEEVHCIRANECGGRNRRRKVSESANDHYGDALSCLAHR